MASSTSNRAMVETVHSLRKQLTTAVSNSNTQEIKTILNRLRKEVVPTEELIRTTKIGISVGKQRQNADPDISKLAKQIVNEWKNGVKREPGPASSASAVGTPSAAAPGLSAVSSAGGGKSTLSSKVPASSTPQPASKPTLPSSSTTITTPANGSLAKKKTGPRSSRTEDGLNFDARGDKVRDGSLRAVFDALISDSDAPADLVYERALSIEAEAYKTNQEQSGSALYKNKMRSLIFNLRDKNNPGLREAVVSGELGASKLCSMGPQDMASEERKAQDRKLAEENLFKARGAGPQQAETDAFRCGRCGQRKCTYYQMQTRSADEPMTTFVTCVNCNNRWKFS